MRNSRLLGILFLFLVPTLIYAFGLPSLPSFGGFGSGSSKPFGGKIKEVNTCFCPTEPQKFGYKWIDYEIFWDGGTLTTKSLMDKKFITRLYDYKKVDEGVWHLGMYKDESISCKYVTAADWAEALYPVPHPPKCSGKYDASGSIIYAGTSQGS